MNTEINTETVTTQFDIDSHVYTRNYRTGPAWIPGTISAKIGKAIYMVSTDIGTLKKHANQIQMRIAVAQSSNNKPVGTPASPPPKRYPTRNRKQPDWYKP